MFNSEGVVWFLTLFVVIIQVRESLRMIWIPKWTLHQLQKKDLVAAVQKEKAEKKVPKKVESSDESDSSDSEEEEKVYY